MRLNDINDCILVTETGVDICTIVVSLLKVDSIPSNEMCIVQCPSVFKK